jgi:hypothetical protein
MERKTQTGYLMLADISGYTSFVANTEIEPAHVVLSFLLENLVEALSACLPSPSWKAMRSFAIVKKAAFRGASPCWA